MTAKKKRITTSIIIVTLIAVLIIVSVVIDKSNDYDFAGKTYIFNSLEDLDFLNDKVVANNIKDSNIGNLTYDSCRTLQVEYEGKNYNLFAYRFGSKEDVFAYGKAATGNDYKNVGEKFGGDGWVCSQYVNIIVPVSVKAFVYNGTNVLYVESKTSKKQFNGFIEYLFTNLPQKVEILPR